MKNIKKRILIFISLFIFMPIINAKCTDEYIINKGEMVAIGFSWEAAQIDKPASVTLNIDGLDEDLFVVVKNETTNERETFKDVKEGLVTIDTPSTTTQYKYSVSVYSQAQECDNELLKKETVVSPIYNRWSSSTECSEIYMKYAEKNSDKFEEPVFCSPFSKKTYTEKEFKQKYSEYLDKLNEPTVKEKLIDKFYKYYYFALIPILALTVYYIIKLKKIRERKKAQDEN